MLFASLINHHAVHQTQVPHGNFISYAEKTDIGRVTYLLFPSFFPLSFSLSLFFFLFVDSCVNYWPVWDPYYFHGIAAQDWLTCLN